MEDNSSILKIKGFVLEFQIPEPSGCPLPGTSTYYLRNSDNEVYRSPFHLLRLKYDKGLEVSRPS